MSPIAGPAAAPTAETACGDRGGNGGAIYNAGTLGAFRVTFDGNAGGEGGRTWANCCEESGNGGAVYNESAARMPLVAAIFTGNATSSPRNRA